MSLKVALIQLVSQSEASANLQTIDSLLKQARNQACELVVLPENAFCYGASPDTIHAIQTDIHQQLANWAREHQIWLVGGSLPWLEQEFSPKPSASCFVFSPAGKEVLHYRKCHLFDADVADSQGAYRESDHYSAGETPGLFDTPWGVMGVGICYDLRFPEYFRLLSQAGAKAVFLPSAFTYVTGEAHWEVLLRARAIENQFFMLAANQGGVHSATRKTWGESMAVDPWGRVLGKCGQGEAIVSVEINFADQNEIQRKMPVLKHRKF